MKLGCLVFVAVAAIGCSSEKDAPAGKPAPKGPPTAEHCAELLAHQEKIMSDIPFTDSLRQRFLDECPTTYTRAEISCALKATDMAGLNACDPANK